MPIIKEVFFRHKKKVVSLLNKEEMLAKAESWLTQSAKLNPTEKQKSMLHNLNWFQKISISEKELFVEKSGNPLKIKNELVEKEHDQNEWAMIIFISFCPAFFLPVFVFLTTKNWLNKRKIKKGNPVYLKNMHGYITFFAILLMLVNILSAIALMVTHSLFIYVGLVMCNFLAAIINTKLPYLHIENYDLVNFSLEANELEDLDGIEAKIMNMKAQDVQIKRGKIDFDFTQENEQIKSKG